MASIGRAYEIKLRKLLENKGFTVRQSSSSEFPDLICWDELNPEYIELARKRIIGDSPRFNAVGAL